MTVGLGPTPFLGTFGFFHPQCLPHHLPVKPFLNLSALHNPWRVLKRIPIPGTHPEEPPRASECLPKGSSVKLGCLSVGWYLEGLKACESVRTSPEHPPLSSPTWYLQDHIHPLAEMASGAKRCLRIRNSWLCCVMSFGDVNSRQGGGDKRVCDLASSFTASLSRSASGPCPESQGPRAVRASLSPAPPLCTAVTVRAA